MPRLLDLAAAVPVVPVDPAAVVDGSPLAGSRALTTVAGAEVGVWEMTVGTATDVEVDEVFHVLSGSATVTSDDGEVLELVAGTTVRLYAGERTTWVVHETLRKLYVA